MVTLLTDLDNFSELRDLAPKVRERVRAHAARLRREIELAAPSSDYWDSHVTAVLKRINEGPPSAGLEAASSPREGMEPNSESQSVSLPRGTREPRR